MDDEWDVPVEDVDVMKNVGSADSRIVLSGIAEVDIGLLGVPPGPKVDPRDVFPIPHGEKG